MKRFDVISVDLFGTLVDIECIAPAVWRQILRENYTPELAKEYWDRVTVIFFQIFETLIQDKHYQPFKAMYRRCYSQFLPEIGLEFDPGEAAQILFGEHTNSSPFDDTQPFLNAAGEKHKVCLSSDTDVDMMGNLKNLYPFDRVFTSEEIGSYKASKNGRFFTEVLNHYSVEPERVIHIGDSVSDITGAGEAGIVTCWLNRKGKTWAGEIMPDYEVDSLIEALALPGLEMNL